MVLTFWQKFQIETHQPTNSGLYQNVSFACRRKLFALSFKHSSVQDSCTKTVLLVLSAENAFRYFLRRRRIRRFFHRIFPLKTDTTYKGTASRCIRNSHAAVGANREILNGSSLWPYSTKTSCCVSLHDNF